MAARHDLLHGVAVHYESQMAGNVYILLFDDRPCALVLLVAAAIDDHRESAKRK
jgi:hypothetical protein